MMLDSLCWLERVDDFEEREPVEIRISCADPSDPMLTHENRCVRVVEQVAGQVRKLCDDLSTSSDIVRPWRAASRLSCAMTVSSMVRVVFIWKTISAVWP